MESTNIGEHFTTLLLVIDIKDKQKIKIHTEFWNDIINKLDPMNVNNMQKMCHFRHIWNIYKKLNTLLKTAQVSTNFKIVMKYT